MELRFKNITSRLKSSKMFKGFSITLFGSGISKLILMLATFIFTHLMTKDDFGSFSFVRNTLNLILCVCALNYASLITKFTAELEYKPEAKFRCVLLILFSLSICFILGICLMGIPKNTLFSIIGNTSMITHFRIIGLLLPLFMIQPLVEGIFRGFKKFKIIGALQIITSILFVALIVGGILLNGLVGAVVGLLSYYFIYSIISLIVFLSCGINFINRKCLDLDGIKKEARIIWTMILPIFLLSFIEAPVNWWAQVLLSKYDTMGAVGSMSAILQIRNLLIIIPGYFFSTFTTFQASLNAQGDSAEYFNNIKKTILGCILVGIVGTAILCICGKFILSLYGNEYTNDIAPFHIAMAGFPLLLLINLLRCNMLIKEHQRAMLFISILSSFAQIFLMYMMLPHCANPVAAYFWGQNGYCIIMFLSFITISYIDYHNERNTKVIREEN